MNTVKKRTTLYIIIGLTALLIICGAIALNRGEKPQSPAELLSLGEKYLSELNYEQALVQFIKVIEIEPMNAKAYEGAARAYIGLGQTDNALEILRRGIEATGDPALQALLDELTATPGEASEQTNTLAMSEAWTDQIGLGLPVEPMSIYDIPGITANVIAMFEDGPVPSGDESNAQRQRFGVSSSWLYKNIRTEQEEYSGFRVFDMDTGGDYCYLADLDGTVFAVEFTDEALRRLWGFSYEITSKDDVLKAFPAENTRENEIIYYYGDHWRLIFRFNSDSYLTQWCAAYWN